KAPFIIGNFYCFVPDSIWVWLWGEDHEWNNYAAGEPNDGMIGLMLCDGSWVDGGGNDRYHYILESEEPLPDVPCSYYYSSSPEWSEDGTYFWPGQTTITKEPYLGRELFWVKIGEAVLTSENQEFRQTFEYTRGSSETSTESFARMMGASATVEVGGSYGILSASVSATLYGEMTTSEEHSVQIYQEKTESKEFSSGGPTGGGSRVVVVWQKAERFRVVDANGNRWDDPAVHLEVPAFEHRLEAFLIDATDFD
ncbi:MAG: hypothetical protein ABIH26_07380, partial [Candidatus Eisenbacteria bacterium]